MSNVIPEQWKRYDENYWVSDQGRVKREYKNGRVNYLTPVPRSKGDKSLRVKICNRYVSLRRLIWKTFKGEIPDGYGVVNKNRCHTMNELYNLELLPINKCVAMNSKSRKKKIVNLDTGVVYPSSREAEKYLHMTHTTIVNYCLGKIKNPVYNLEYFDEDKNYKKTLHFIRD